MVGNEKGGAGKSTIAVHLAAALLHEGARMTVVDLDIRQQSTGHFFANRCAWSAANGVVLPGAGRFGPATDEDALAEALDADADFILIDTPGADTELSRAAHGPPT